MRKYDDETPPDDGICLNCAKNWGDHSGWSCIEAGGVVRKSKLKPDRQYFSHTMHAEEKAEEAKRLKVMTRDDGLPAIAAMQASAPDLSDWKLWRDVNRNPDECPCGIRRSACRYH